MYILSSIIGCHGPARPSCTYCSKLMIDRSIDARICITTAIIRRSHRIAIHEDRFSTHAWFKFRAFERCMILISHSWMTFIYMLAGSTIVYCTEINSIHCSTRYCTLILYRSSCTYYVHRTSTCM